MTGSSQNMARATAPITTGLRPLRRTDMTVHELDGEALVYDAATADTHRLNETALFIWRQCDGRLEAPQVAQRLTAVYDVPLESAIEHVGRMFQELAERQLVLTNLLA